MNATMTHRNVVEATRRAKRWGEPCVVWVDELERVAYSRLSWYQSAEGQAFASDTVLAVVDEDGVDC